MSDIKAQIELFNKGRNPLLLKLKYQAMKADKYSFFRATTHIFYEEIPKNSFLFNGPKTWLCGDLHLENFGSYKGNNGIIYFNINDFDECILGSCLLDIVRMLCCIYIAAQNLKFNKKEATEQCSVFLNTYFNELQKGYIHIVEKDTSRGEIKNLLENATERKRKDFLRTKTIKKNGELKLLINNKHTSTVSNAEKQQVIDALNKWSAQKFGANAYKVKDVAFRIAGTSSLGLNRYIVLIEKIGETDSFHFLDIKEARPSCLTKNIKTKQPEWTSEADRISEIQRRVLANPPALLSSININHQNYLLKHLQPSADKIDHRLFVEQNKKMTNLLEDLGGIFAWNNMRSSSRQGSATMDELIEFAQNSKNIKKELLDYALEYSKTIDTYYQTFCSS